jgi:hypothetical protein
MSTAYRTIYTFLSKKWHFDQLTSELITVKSMNFGYRTSFQLMDKGNIELFGPLGLAYNLGSFSKTLSTVQSGFLYHYSFVMMSFVIALISYFIVIHFELTGFYDSSFLVLFFSYFLFSLNKAK